MAAKTATATVQLTVKINVTDTWGPNCTTQQVREQATESAIGALRRALGDGKVAAVIEGTPKVTMIMTEV